MQLLSVHVSKYGSTSAVVSVAGELDAGTCRLLEGILTPLVAQGHVHLVVKAQHLSFCDVGGARVFERTYRTVSDDGGSLVIFTNRNVIRLFRLLWAQTVPASPTVIQAEPEPPPEAPRQSNAARHVLRLRSVSGGRPGPHRSPSRTPARGESVLERSRQLRAQAAIRLEVMCEQVRSATPWRAPRNSSPPSITRCSRSREDRL